MSGIWNFDFEGGVLTGLTQYNAGGGDDISVSAAAKLAGTNYGLACLINDATSNYLYTAALSPVNTSGRWRWRLYIDPNTAAISSGNSIIFYALRGGGNYIVLLYLTRTGTDYYISAECYNDAGGSSVTSTYIITDAEHYVECDLIRATNSTSSDGSLQLWIDGTSKQTLSAIDNYDRDASINGCRLGMITKPASSSGTFYLDEFILNDDGSAIGPLGANRTMTADAVSFTLTGIDAGLTATHNPLTAAADAFTLTGQDAGLLAKYVLTAGAGSFTLTGQDTGLTATHNQLTAAAGAFSLTGQDAGLTATHNPLTAAASSFILTTQDTGLMVGYRLIADTAPFTLTGQAVILTVTPVGSGGSPLGLLLILTNPSYQERKLTASPGNFTQTGNPADLLGAFILTAAATSFGETGQDAGLLIGYHLDAGAGDFALTGNDAAVSFSGLNYYTLTADGTAFAHTGNAAGLLAGRSLTADLGAYIMDGISAAVLRGLKLSAAGTAFDLTYNYAGVLAGYRISTAAGAFTLTGINTTLLYQQTGAYTLLANTGAYSATGIDAGLLVALILTADVSDYLLTGKDAAFITGSVSATPTKRIYVIRGETRVYIVPFENRTYEIKE